MEPEMDYSRCGAIYTKAPLEITLVAELVAESPRTSTRNKSFATTILWNKKE
jgi:hypothetical protein